MRIAFILPSLANKGPIIVAQDLCKGLIKEGHTCKVFYFDDIVDIEIPCEVERISFWGKFDFSQWDIVHSHMLRPDLWVALHMNHKKGRPRFVTTIHQNISQTLTLDYGRMKAFLVGSFWKLSLKRFDKVVVLTTEHLHSVGSINSSRLVVVHNGRNINLDLDIDETDVDVVKQFCSNHQTVLCSNSIVTSRKGLEQIIKALVLCPQCGYIIIGDGPQVENLKALSRELGVNDRCLWLGFRELGYRYLWYADIYMLPSRSEGFPLSMIEAAALGKPIICSDIPIFRSIVTCQEVTFVPLDDPKTMSLAIKRVDEDSDIFSNRVKELYSSSLTREIMCKNYIDLYYSL